jgi:phage shock protein PspC (stress-responsive transcriptional regulator)
MAKARTLSVLQVSLILVAFVMLSVFIAAMFIVPQQPNAQQGTKFFF